MIDTDAKQELMAREIPMQNDAWRRETSTSEHTASDSSPFSRTSHPVTRVPQPLSQVPAPAPTGTFTRESVEQAYQTAFGALRSYPDRYLDGLRAASQARLGTVRQAADDDVLAIEALRAQRHAEVDAEASSAIAARRAALQSELADASGRLEAEISRARAEIAAYEAQLAGFEAQTAAFLERTTSPADWSAPAPEARTAAAPAPEARTAAAPAAALTAVPADSGAGVLVEAAPALEFTPEPEPEAAAQFTPEPEVEAMAEAIVAEPAAEALVTTESTEARGATAESVAAVADEPDPAAAEVAEPVQAKADASEAAAVLEQVDADAAAAVFEPEMDADEPIASLGAQVLKTTIAVRGLADVASIAAFMRLLTRASGIGSVQVRTEGPGEVFFAVSHDPDADLTRLVRSLWPFEVRVLEAQPGSMTVATRDPYAA